MPRAPCLPIVRFGWYYVSRNAVDNRKIIVNPLELTVFRELLAATLAEHGMCLYFAYLDETELHLALRTGEKGLGEILGICCQRFAHQVNRERGETGPLFRPHATVRLVEPGKWFLCVGRFIHWIPELTGKEPQIDELRWNTDTFYRDRKRVCGVAASTIFRSVSRGSRNIQVQDQAYRSFFGQRPSADEIELIRRGFPQDRRIIAEPAFITQMGKQQGFVLQPRLQHTGRTQEDIQAATAAMAERFQRLCDEQLMPRKARQWTRLVTPENLRSKSREQPLPMFRALCAAYLLSLGVKLEQIEQFFHCRPSTLSSGRRSRYRLQFEEVFGRRCKELFEVSDGRERVSERGPRVREIAHEPRWRIDAWDGGTPPFSPSADP
jgi:hypothetical protein